MTALIVQFLCPFGYSNTFSSSICISIIIGTGIIVSFGVSFLVRGTRKAENKKYKCSATVAVSNLPIQDLKVECSFSIVIWSEFRIEQYRDDYHREEALQFNNFKPNKATCSSVENR